ncbi:MAG: AAA family ATPase [Bacteroidetes bacterium GWF2_43_63]|nr:MAG: AAA family ATPase [Bacteroidetes bacterium GWE2_42_42]OFY54193.1 MAG: AAA family ATPase [Bacteroidetes bacterium GWF2_43_63]HBG69625.1 AAA family ATPase [Bacteroidales bacterium]HCB61483.1 AAA family ATPase [Bacteroidales bacterium]HCY22467.1 AAA family ATPase [Bacteroidales bacterium]
METLFQKQQSLLARTDLSFKRYMFDKFPWNSRMTGLVGPRGVGKTTMILQYIKEHKSKDILYVSADDIHFANQRLTELADDFYKNGGKHLFIDEIHKYRDWSVELKNMYDFYPGLKVCFTGSSVLDIRKGMADLSRRALMFSMQGFSFREYLKFRHKIDIAVHSIKDIIKNRITMLDSVEHPLPLFREYLKSGYYPMAKEDNFDIRLGQILNITLEVDIPQFANLSVTTARKLKKLLLILSESVPFKPNFVSLAAKLEVSRNSLEEYFTFMEDAGLIARLRDQASGIIGLGKVEKVYLDNSGLVYFLSENKPEIGNIRETFFLNQMRVNHSVVSSAVADFKIDKYTFEVGGKSKSQQQIKSTANAFIVKDNIEYGHQNVVPLWAFGLNY